VLLQICAKAEFFDLSKNHFDFPDEEKGGKSFLRHLVANVRNLGHTELIDLNSQKDLTGTGK
jgi:hypothetical protein